MLELMRKGLKSWFGKALILLFIAPFLFLGAESFFTVFTNSNAAIEVNGEKITEQQIINAVESNKERIRQRFGADFDMSVFSAEALREGASGQLIEAELLKKYAEKHDLSVSFKKLSEIIRAYPVFSGSDGQFSQEIFETIAAQQRISSKYLVELIKGDVSVGQIQEAVTSSAFGLKTEVQRLESLRLQKRDFSYLYLSLDDFRKSVSVSDEEIKDYYENNSAMFRTIESARIEYIELRAKDFEQDISISNEDIVAQFESEQAKLNQNTARKASHILITVDGNTNEAKAFETISEIASKLKNGADFSELAKQVSQDPGSAKQGGDLGFAMKGAYVPEFEEALYSLNVGEVSAPVLTEFGYHLIKLTEIAATQKLDFNKEKSRIETQLKAKFAYDLYQQKIAELEELVYENPDLDEPALALATELKVSQIFTRSAGEGIAANKDIRDLAFSNAIMKESENSSVVEVGQGHAIALRLNQHFPSELKPLETVSDEITFILKTMKAEEALAKMESELLAMLEAGENLESVSKTASVTWQKKVNAERRISGVDPQILKQAFEMPRSADGHYSFASVDVNEGDVAIVSLEKVHETVEQPDEQRLNALVRQANFNTANSDWRAHLDYMKSQADITYNRVLSGSGLSGDDA